VTNSRSRRVRYPPLWAGRAPVGTAADAAPNRQSVPRLPLRGA
jgi:hypothetical protein